ncbi:MAG: response regulator transcription factor [Chitinophagaceae bacterium]|jgi:DNA-binding NarL/FixJ family response regulator|nr:response regulator transcription factor [Chitinophagaceae bacterium]
MKEISVCIVEDNKDIRQALEQIVSMSDGYHMAGSFPDAESALAGLPVLHPHIVLMDINLGGMSGIEVVRLLKPRYPDMLFMMCTVYEEDEQIFEALAAGANGYILKKTAPARLLESIRELHEGGAPMSSQIARKVVAAFSKTPKTHQVSLDTLSNRESEILVLLAKGLLYKEIAHQLNIAQETVRKHVYHIYEKLHVNNRVEAVNKYFGR